MSDSSDRTMGAASAGTIDMLLTLAEAGIPEAHLWRVWHHRSRPSVRGTGAPILRPPPALHVQSRSSPRLDHIGEPTLVLNDFGHGTNSYALTLFVTAGPVAAFVQHLYGGVYTEPVFAREQIASTYARLSILLSRGRFPPGPAQWLLLYSQLRDVTGLIDLHHYTPGQQWRKVVEFSEDQTTLFRSTAAPKFPDADFDFPAEQCTGESRPQIPASCRCHSGHQEGSPRTGSQAPNRATGGTSEPGFPRAEPRGASQEFQRPAIGRRQRSHRAEQPIAAALRTGRREAADIRRHAPSSAMTTAVISRIADYGEGYVVNIQRSLNSATPAFTGPAAGRSRRARPMVTSGPTATSRSARCRGRTWTSGRTLPWVAGFSWCGVCLAAGSRGGLSGPGQSGLLGRQRRQGGGYSGRVPPAACEGGSRRGASSGGIPHPV